MPSTVTRHTFHKYKTCCVFEKNFCFCHLRAASFDHELALYTSILLPHPKVQNIFRSAPNIVLVCSASLCFCDEWMQLCSERVSVIPSGCTSVPERGLISGGRGDEVEL
jgi:hypothetical protein